MDPGLPVASAAGSAGSALRQVPAVLRQLQALAPQVAPFTRRLAEAGLPTVDLLSSYFARQRPARAYQGEPQQPKSTEFGRARRQLAAEYNQLPATVEGGAHQALMDSPDPPIHLLPVVN